MFDVAPAIRLAVSCSSSFTMGGGVAALGGGNGFADRLIIELLVEPFLPTLVFGLRLLV